MSLSLRNTYEYTGKTSDRRPSIYDKKGGNTGTGRDFPSLLEKV